MDMHNCASKFDLLNLHVRRNSAVGDYWKILVAVAPCDKGFVSINPYETVQYRVPDDKTGC